MAENNENGNQRYIVKYVRHGQWGYIASPDLNDTTADKAKAYRWNRVEAQKRAKWLKGHQQVRFSPVQPENDNA